VPDGGALGNIRFDLIAYATINSFSEHAAR